MAEAVYSLVERFEIDVECVSPLHIGSAEGKSENVLIHPIKRTPFVQATGIAGVFRTFYEKQFGLDETKALFGDFEVGDELNGSLIKFSDGFFDKKTVKFELRPRLKINEETGTCSESKTSGGGTKSGHKFEMEHVGAGSKFNFSVHIFAEKSYKEHFIECLEAMNAGALQFGGQKSNGNGNISICKVLYHKYDMRKVEDRHEWINENPLSDKDKITLNKEGCLDKASAALAYTVKVKGKTEGGILVRAIAVTDDKEDAPDAVNIRNAKKEYIIPASSVKGSVRSRMEMIAKRKNLTGVIDNAFGKVGEENRQGVIGNLRFKDAVIGDTEKNDLMPNNYRIKIDKFTGGVMDKALFSERDAYGTVNLEIFEKIRILMLHVLCFCMRFVILRLKAFLSEVVQA